MSRRLRKRFEIRNTKGKRTRIRKDMIGAPSNFQHVCHGGTHGAMTDGDGDGQLKNDFDLIDLAEKQKSLNSEKLTWTTQQQSQDLRSPTAKETNDDHPLEDVKDSIHSPPIAKESSPIYKNFFPLEKSQRQRRSFRLKKKKKIRNDMIGSPYNFQHISHAGFDGDNNFFQFNLEKQIEDEIRDLISNIGLTQSQMSRPKTREFVYNILEQHGVLQEARRESQRLSGQSFESRGHENVNEVRDHESKAKHLETSTDSEDLSKRSSPRQERSPEGVPKSQNRTGKRQAPRPPTEVKVDAVITSDVTKVSTPSSGAQVIHCIVSEGSAVHTVTSYVIKRASPAATPSVPPKENSSNLICINQAPTPPPIRKSFVS